MTLNASATSNTNDELNVGAEQNGRAPSRDRELVISELLDELTGWSSRDRMGMFKRWHEGALSLVHLNVLTMLEIEGALSMSRLADGLDVSVASVTGIVDRMERRGLVERRHDSDDRRLVVVHLTEGGAAVFRALAVDRRLRLTRVLGELQDDELAALLKGIRAMHGARQRLYAQEAGTSEPGKARPSAAGFPRPESEPEPPPAGEAAT